MTLNHAARVLKRNYRTHIIRRQAWEDRTLCHVNPPPTAWNVLGPDGLPFPFTMGDLVAQDWVCETHPAFVPTPTHEHSQLK